MAVIRMGMGAEARGSMGGIVFSRNRGGAYIRNRTHPVNPNSTRQSEQRNLMREASDQWASLTQPQRDAWNAYAPNVTRLNKLGETIQTTGRAEFIAVNILNATLGLAARTATPLLTTASLGNLEIELISGDAAVGLTCSGGSWQTAGGALGIFTSSQLGPTQKSTKQPMTLRAIADGATDFDPQVFIQAVLPTAVAANNRYVIGLRAIDANGQYTQMLKFNMAADSVFPEPVVEA